MINSLKLQQVVETPTQSLNLSTIKIPDEYVWKEIPLIKAHFLMPDNWFFVNIHSPKTYTYFLTRESIPQNGIFITGLTIKTFIGFGQKVTQIASYFAREILQTLPVVQPLDQIKIVEDGPLTICKRQFFVPVKRSLTTSNFCGKLITKLVPPSHLYYLAVGNKNTGTTYVIWFETPSSKWQKDRKTAEIMINHAIFNKSI